MRPVSSGFFLELFWERPHYTYRMTTQNKALYVRLVAKVGMEEALESFLKGGLTLVNEEPLTLSWYALKLDDRTYGIFDTFEGEQGRDAHLQGSVAKALMASADDLLAEPPSIEKVEIIAVKVS